MDSLRYLDVPSRIELFSQGLADPIQSWSRLYVRLIEGKSYSGSYQIYCFIESAQGRRAVTKTLTMRCTSHILQQQRCSFASWTG